MGGEINFLWGFEQIAMNSLVILKFAPTVRWNLHSLPRISPSKFFPLLYAPNRWQLDWALYPCYSVV